MILNLDGGLVIDMDKIVALKKVFEGGIVVFSGSELKIGKEEFDAVEKAYVWQHKDHMYNKDLSFYKTRGKDEE